MSTPAPGARRVVVITGGGGGIGSAMAKDFATAGHRVTALRSSLALASSSTAG
jgi:NAD(P)-dependent dehydrogenase (short-subunit alcohol dehydrogenase family)